MGKYNNDIEKLGEYFRNYSVDNYKNDWKLCMSNSFKKSYKKFSNIEYWMDKFKERMLLLGIVSLIDGVYVGEYNKNYDLGSHSLIYFESELSDNEVRSKMWKWWSSKGSVDIKKYNDEGFDFYISKFLYKGWESNFNYLGNNRI